MNVSMKPLDATEQAASPEADLAHWRGVVAAKPTHQPALRSLARAMAAVGDAAGIEALAAEYRSSHADLADAILQVGTRLMPAERGLWLAYAEGSAGSGVAQQNLRWMLAHKRFPEDPEIALGYGRVLMQQRRFGPVDTVVTAALSHAADNVALNALLADAAEARSDWPGAVSYLSALVKLAPGHPEYAARLERAEATAETEEVRGMKPQPLILPDGALPAITAASADAMRDLLGHFESIGANCELGLLQRKFGAEPLGLLRFAGTLPRAALILLRSRFEGIGDPAEMSITATPQEYRMRHMKSGWGMHTRIRPTPDVPEEKVFKEQCRHTSFLRKKLVRELEQGDKIFVYQRFVLTDREINDIYAAVQGYGPNMMLMVRVADEAHPVGAIEWRTERLLIAAIDRAGLDQNEGGWDISVDYWVYFCRLAKERFDALRAASAANTA